MHVILITLVNFIYLSVGTLIVDHHFFFSPDKEKGLKKRAKLYPQENGEKSVNGLSKEYEERRENGDGDSDNEPEEVRERFYSLCSNWSAVYKELRWISKRVVLSVEMLHGNVLWEWENEAGIMQEICFKAVSINMRIKKKLFELSWILCKLHIVHDLIQIQF